MKNKYTKIAFLAGTALVIWAVFSWPLPRHFNSGIPQSDHNVEKDHVREMIPGDQLQLMYHFWLAKDMIAGKTPPFNNVYEFNRGEDEGLKKADPYYIPYSLVFAFFNTFLSRAASWNLAGLLSILCTFLSSFFLIKRLTGCRLAAFTSALLASTFPYRWITLLIGSPTGYAISLIPLTVLGLHIAVKDNKWIGGFIAGVAIFFSYCSDLHVVYFNMLSVPFWCITFLIIKEDFRFRSPKTWIKPGLALAPTIALAGLTGVIASKAGSHLDNTDMGGGRPWPLVVKYSPRSRGLFSWDNLGMDNHVFLGHIATLFVLVALVALIVALVRKRETSRNMIFAGLLFLASLSIVSLALGGNGIGEGSMMLACRKFVPKYAMIRQSVKIYCLMPTFIAVLIGLGVARLPRINPDRKLAARVIICVLALLCIVEWRMQISPTICILTNEQPAYAAIRADADKRNVDPHIAVVPLWPGDSHWSSLYEHYASLYRIRMLNGYSPAIGNEYMESVVKPLDTINRGVISQKQIQLMRSMGVDYLIFHQDAYPDQVSPYPASQTLFRFLAHPNLQLIAQSQSIWAFKLLTEGREIREPLELPEFIFSMRGWELESRGILQDYGDVVSSDRASGPVLKLTSKSAEMQSRPFPNTRGQQMNLRIKGHGSFTWQVMADDELAATRDVEVKTDEWDWITLPFETSKEHFIPTIKFLDYEGDIYLDMMFLSAGAEVRLQPGEEVTIPAAALYGQGYIDLADMSVTLRKDRDQDLEVLYAMFPLLEKGIYQVELAIESDSDSEPGSLVYLAHTTHPFTVPIEKPGDFVHIYKHPDNFPVKIGFKYSRNADLTVKHMKMKRIE